MVLKKIKKKLKFRINIKILFINIIFFFFNISKIYFKSKINFIKYNNFDNLKIKNYINENDFKNITVAIIRRTSCNYCGLFSDYIVFLGCINLFLTKGYFPVIDMQSYNNIFNKFNVSISNLNPWEFFFDQPFGERLDNVKKKAISIKYFECNKKYRPTESVFYNKLLQSFWHNLSKFYMPIKINILTEARKIFKRLFKDSHNILGILMRGTDYLANKPKGHYIPPTPSMVIKDIKKINLKNNYDWFFISTEDDMIRDIFIKEFGFKIKYLVFEKTKYNYKKKNALAYNSNVKGLNYSKIYLINLIILSKCIDILSANTSGSIGVFILSEGFRYSKVYNLGKYK